MLILGDKRDPVAPEAVCLRFAQTVRNATVLMVYDEGAIIRLEKDALERRRLCGAAREIRIGPHPEFNSARKSASRLRVHSPKPWFSVSTYISAVFRRSAPLRDGSL